MRLSSFTTLFTLLAELQQQQDIDTFYSTLLSAVSASFKVETVAVLAIEPSEGLIRLSHAYGHHKEFLCGYSSRTRSGLYAQVIDERRHGRIFRASDLALIGLTAPVRSADLFPMIMHEGQVTELLMALNADLTQENQRFLEAYAAQVGLIIHNHALIQRLKKGSQYLTTLVRIAQGVWATRNAEQLFDLILESSLSLVGAEKGSLMLMDDQEGRLAIKAVKGANKHLLESVRVAPHEGISGKVLATGASLLVSDLERDERVGRKQNPRYRTKSFISVPLKPDRRTIGVLNICDKVSGEAFSPEDLERVATVANYATLAIERSVLHQKTEELTRLSILDPLTGLVNRRHFEERLREEVERTKRHHSPLSLIMVDLDDFKAINDRFGHLVGDQALQTAARIIRQTVRTVDVACRYGGEEFAIILPHTPTSGAITIAERICSEFRKMDLGIPQGKLRHAITGSLGVASYSNLADTPEALIQQSDAALYTAKQRGKDQVVVFKAE